MIFNIRIISMVFSPFRVGAWFLLLLFSSCHKEAAIPAYIHIDSFTLATNYPIEGSTSSKIVDAWIDVDGQSIGAFELPCTVPVLYSGAHTVTIWPGIKENGSVETRVQYHFYNIYTQAVVFTPGSVLQMHPATSYASYAVFSYIEDFDGGGTGLCDTTGTDTSMRVFSASGIKFEGSGSGGVILSGSKTQYYGATCAKYDLPITTPVYLEMNYNCNAQFNVGIKAYSAAGSYVGQTLVMTLKPTTDWNKTYINLSGDIGRFGVEKYSIFFSMLKSADSSAFYIDNVKLIH